MNKVKKRFSSFKIWIKWQEIVWNLWVNLEFIKDDEVSLTDSDDIFVLNLPNVKV